MNCAILTWCFAASLLTDEVNLESPRPLREDGLAGYVSIVPINSAVSTGQSLEIAIFFSGSGNYQKLVNPFWERSETLPGRVAAFDEHKMFIGWLAIGGASEGREVPKVEVHGTITVGSAVNVDTGLDTVVRERNGKRQVSSFGPGKYFLQTIYTSEFLERVGRPRTIAISEPASFTVLPPTGVIDDTERPPNGRVEVSLSKGLVRIGEGFMVQTRFINTTGKPMVVFNPFSDRLTRPLGVQLLVYDDRDKLLSNYLEWHEGSMVLGGLWLTLPPNAIVGTTIGCSLNYLHFRKIPPGEYFLRAAYTESFFSKNPNVDNPNPNAYRDWLRKHDNDKPQLMSAPLPIKLLPAIENGKQEK